MSNRSNLFKFERPLYPDVPQCDVGKAVWCGPEAQPLLVSLRLLCSISVLASRLYFSFCALTYREEEIERATADQINDYFYKEVQGFL